MTAPDVDALVARVDALALAHIEEMMALRIASGGDVLMVPVGSLRALLAALREARADGERLDWLERDHNAKVYPSREFGDFGVRIEHEEGCGFSASGKVRTAIDAARAAGDPK